MPTKIMKCDGISCQSDYQDKRYGKGNRVHNSLLAPETNGYKCTVCSTVHKATVKIKKEASK